MKISEHVHAIRLPFRIPIGPGRTLERFVHAWLVLGERICLIDGGVAGSQDAIFEAVRKAERDPGEIDLLVLTHAHPDHVGGARGIREATGCRVAAHAGDIPWVEDVARQNRERPVPGFHTLVEGSVKVDLAVKDGERLDRGGGGTLRVLHTPGHAKGHIALFHEEDGALIAGDAVPVPGEVPIYEDAVAAVRSIARLREAAGVKILLSSWDASRRNGGVREALDAGTEHVRTVHREVLLARDALGSADPAAVGARVRERLGLPEAALNPIFFTTVAAHLRAGDHPDLQGA